MDGLQYNYVKINNYMKILYHGNIYEHFNYQNPLKGGIGDNLKVNERQLKIGEKVEGEHIDKNKDMPKSQKEAIKKDIARDHLVEFPDYYEELDKMENKLGEKHRNDKFGKAYRQEKLEEK